MQGRADPNRELLDAAALCRQLIREGSVEAFLADHRSKLFPDQLFEDLFPSTRGRPSIPAEVVASVMVLQAPQGLSDRDAARALRDRISWKVACGLALDDEGFDYSVLTYWQLRLRKSERPERIFEVVHEVVTATGILKGKTRRALDSTLLDDAVATQDTVTQLISAIRRVRREVPGAREVGVSAHDYESAGKHAIAWDDEVAKAALIEGLVKDALNLLSALKATEETLTPANVSDATTGVTLLADAAPGLQILADGAYGSGDALAALEEAGHEAAIKPYPSSLRSDAHFHREDFMVDEGAGTATCPAGHTVRINRARRAVFGARCATCPLRTQCTTSKRGRLKLHLHDALLVESRQAWREGDFAEAYRRWRPMVERSIAWLVAHGNRRVRFRGVQRNQFGLTTRVAALNLRRLIGLGLQHDGGWTLATA